jgi:hypothetical protein
MDLANFEDFKLAFQRLQQQTQDLSRAYRKRERGRKSASSHSPHELVDVAGQLAEDATEVVRLSRAKGALLLRRERASCEEKAAAGS